MKLAYPVGTPETRGKMLAYQGEFESICANVKTIGYTGVELFVRNPLEMNMPALFRIIERKGLEVAAIGTGPVVAEDKLTFAAGDAAVRRAAIERTKTIIDFAAHFSTQVIIGKLRGELQSGTVELSKQWMRDAFMEVCEHALAKDVAITIEPQSRFAINNLNTARQALDWVKDIKAPNLHIMLDSFHMNIEESSMAACLIDAQEHNIHIHLAENNRGIPGTGHIDFQDFIRVLQATNYKHYIALEIDQLPNSLQAAQASYAYLNPLITQCSQRN